MAFENLQVEVLQLYILLDDGDLDKQDSSQTVPVNLTANT